MVDHLLDCQLGHEVGGFQIQVDGTVERGHVCFQEGGLAAPAGVVDENVHLPEGGQGLGQHLCPALFAGQVRGHRDGLPAGLPDLLSGLFRRLGIAAYHGHLGPFPGEGGGDGITDAFAAASDDGGSAC